MGRRYPPYTVLSFFLFVFFEIKTSAFLFVPTICLLLTGCSYHSKRGIQRTFELDHKTNLVLRKIKEKDDATGMLLRIQEQAVNTDVQEMAKSELFSAYPDPTPILDKKDANTNLVVECAKRLQDGVDAKDVLNGIKKENQGIRNDFEKTLEKEVKLSQSELFIAAIGGSLLLYLFFNLLSLFFRNKIE